MEVGGGRGRKRRVWGLDGWGLGESSREVKRGGVGRVLVGARDREDIHNL